MKNEDILKRYDALKQSRSDFDSICNEITRYILPFGGDFLGGTTVNWETKQIWDSTAPMGAVRLASFMHSALASFAFRWFSIAFRNSKINKDPKARAWLDDTSDRMFDTLAASNFGREFASSMLSIVGHGNSFISQELAHPKRWDGIEFSAGPLKDCVYEEDYRGQVRVFYRGYEWTAGQILSKFGEKGTPKDILEMAQSKNSAAVDKRHEIIFCIYPRTDVEGMRFGERVRAPLQRPFGFKYVLRKGAVTLGEEDGYYEMPVYFGGWERMPGSIWCFGPGHQALPTVKLVNVWLEAMTNAAEKAVDPATLVTERGLLSDLDLGKGGLTTVRSLEDIATHESKARFDVSEVILQDARMMIRKYFREDDLTLKTSPQMTFGEAQIRYELMNRVLGGPANRVQTGILDPMLQTTFNMLYREKQLEDPPDLILEEGARMHIEYLGPLMRSQRGDEVAAIERLAAGASAMIKMGFADVQYDFDASAALREMGERLGTPGNCFRTEDDAKKLAENAKQMAQASAEVDIRKRAAEGERAFAGAEQMRREMNG